MNNILRGLLIFLAILLIASIFFAVGYFTKDYINKNSLTTITSTEAIVEDVTTQSLFTTQMGTIQGKITSIEGSNLTIRNSAGVSGTLPAAKNLLVYKASPDKMASGSSNLKSIELGKDAQISITGSKGKFEVTSIYY